jgi:hypothetical protein
MGSPYGGNVEFRLNKKGLTPFIHGSATIGG